MKTINKETINQFNSSGNPDGYWEYYHQNGNLRYKGSYNNGNRDGYWEYYWNDGTLFYKGSYINGNRDGYWEWYENGELSEITFYT